VSLVPADTIAAYFVLRIRAANGGVPVKEQNGRGPEIVRYKCEKALFKTGELTVEYVLCAIASNLCITVVLFSLLYLRTPVGLHFWHARSLDFNYLISVFQDGASWQTRDCAAARWRAIDDRD
jgi:hypothetical protein